MNTRAETYKHIQTVQKFMGRVIHNLLDRAEHHDASKLESPEVELFDEYTPRLAGTEYGSDEYKQLLQQIKPALDHHYATNSHHPEYFGEAGVMGMNLVDVLEMLCDWKAATLRHDSGDIRKSIEINQKRFGYSDELKQLMLNTLPLIEAQD